MQPQKQFLARNFGRKLTHRRVGNLVFGIKPRPGWHVRGEKILQVGDAIARARRDHEGRDEFDLRIEFLRKRQQRWLVGEIDLVEHQHFRRPDVREAFDDGLVLFGKSLTGVDHKRDDVGVLRTAPRRSDHGAIEPPLWRENPRRIDEDDLCRADHDNAAQQSARGLHLLRDDRNLRADQSISQRRLSDIRRADQRYKAAAPFRRFGYPVSCHFFTFTRSRVSIVAAATCSAARLLRPEPSAGARFGNRTSTRNTRLWSGPLRPIS